MHILQRFGRQWMQWDAAHYTTRTNCIVHSAAAVPATFISRQTLQAIGQAHRAGD